MWRHKKKLLHVSYKILTLLSNIYSGIKGETIMETDSADKDPLSKNEMTYLCAFCHFIFQTKSGYMEHTKLGNCVQVSFCTVPIKSHYWKNRTNRTLIYFLCLVHLLPQNLVWAHSNCSSILNILYILKIILVYSKFRFYYINCLIWVYLQCFEYTLKIWVYLKI